MASPNSQRILDVVQRDTRGTCWTASIDRSHALVNSFSVPDHERHGSRHRGYPKEVLTERLLWTLWTSPRLVDSALAIQALNQAVALRQPGSGLIVHSDRGSQFASQAYRDRLERRQFLQSMSRKGNCYDSAPMESLFKSFKSEEVYQRTYQTHEEATRAVADYIDRFYNRKRLHLALGYLSPNDYERRESNVIEQRAESRLRRSHSSVAHPGAGKRSAWRP